LRRIGASDPSQHLYACGANRITTLVVRKTPFVISEINQLRNFCRKNKMAESFAPDGSRGDLRHRIVADPDAAAARNAGTDARPPPDDRPFFEATVPASLVKKTLAEKTASTNAQGLLVLAGLGAVAGVLLFLAVGLPLAAWPRWPFGRARP